MTSFSIISIVTFHFSDLFSSTIACQRCLILQWVWCITYLRLHQLKLCKYSTKVVQLLELLASSPGHTQLSVLHAEKQERGPSTHRHMRLTSNYCARAKANTQQRINILHACIHHQPHAGYSDFSQYIYRVSHIMYCRKQWKQRTVDEFKHFVFACVHFVTIISDEQGYRCLQILLSEPCVDGCMWLLISPHANTHKHNHWVYKYVYTVCCTNHASHLELFQVYDIHVQNRCTCHTIDQEVCSVHKDRVHLHFIKCASTLKKCNEYTIHSVQLTPITIGVQVQSCLLYTSPSPRDATLSRMPSSA